MSGILNHAAMRRPPTAGNTIDDDTVAADTATAAIELTSTDTITIKSGQRWISVAVDQPFSVIFGDSAVGAPTNAGHFAAGVQDFLCDKNETHIRIIAPTTGPNYLIWDSGVKVDA